MRLADDDRARVPFALVGVLLLVSSATLGVSLVSDDRGGADLDADAAMDRGNAATQTAVRSAVADASRRAAADPVVTPTTCGSGSTSPSGTASPRSTSASGALGFGRRSRRSRTRRRSGRRSAACRSSATARVVSASPSRTSR
ncbi:hypothetical protein BRD03_03795 [Halobacteriales archaeon QS_9_68_17]|nr:MAG: hypothetical protein BRD03_03795 [Halobacteriales archaeon QS_9_68_17]